MTEMNSMVRALLILRNHLVEAAEEIGRLVEAHAPKEVAWAKIYPIKCDGKILADFLVNPDRARLELKQPLPTDCGPFGWLVSTLDRYREKHSDFKFQVEERDKQLYGIDFSCKIESEKPFVGWFQWALKRMADKGDSQNSGWERRDRALRSIKEAGRRLTE